VPAISYKLLIDDAPINPDLLAVLQQVEVEEHAEMADMLRLRFAISVSEAGSNWTVVDDNLFPRLTNIKVKVNVGSNVVVPLIDAYVIATNADFSNQPGESVLDVVAMDVTVLMNLEEQVRAWPDMADSDIASTIFGEYGFTPQVESTQPSRQEVDYITTQRSTDIQFLRYLALRNGYEVYVGTNPSTGDVEGHFHPPKLDESPQEALTVNMGETTNVNTFKAQFDMLRPTTAQVTGLDIETQSEQPAQIESQALTGLGGEPALSSEQPRRVLLSQTGLAETGELQTYTQAVVDRSAWTITAEGELNTAAYNGVLRAKHPVNVRGAGRQFSGTYYVEKVLHTFTGDGYTQRFSLRRNALGLTGQESFVEDNALP
jgi:phage protein D